MAVKLRERSGKGWYVVTDWKGQRKTKFFGKDKKLAKAFADKLAAKLKWAEESGEPLRLSSPDGTIPTVQAYFKEWLTTYAEIHCKPATATDYRGALENHIFPALGDRKLHEVSRGDVKRLIASLAGKGLKKQSIHNVLTPFKEGYHHAMDEGIVNSNPVTSMGHLMKNREDPRSRIFPLTAQEVRTLLQVAQEKMPTLYPLFLCAVRTGLREGELLGLQWGDVDFKGGFIEVRRGIVRRQVSTTKTHKIRRVG